MAEHDLHAVAFPKLDEAQIAALGRCPLTTLKHIGTGKSSSRPATATPSFFVVKSGEVEIVDDSGRRRRRPSRSIGPGEFTGDVSQLTGSPAVVSAVARGDCEVYEVSPDALRQLLNHHPDLGDIILQAFIARRQLLRESADFTGLRVIGSRYSQDTFRVRDFLAKNRVLFTWLDLEADPQVKRAAQAVRRDRGRHARGRLGPQAAAAQPLEPRSWPMPSASASRWSRRCTTWSWSGPARRGWRRRSTAPPRGCSTVVLEQHGARAARPAAACASRTTSASPPASPAANWPSRAVLQANKFGALPVRPHAGHRPDVRQCVPRAAPGRRRDGRRPSAC